MPNFTKYCKKCGLEKLEDGDVTTWYEGKKICECDKKEEGLNDNK